MRALSIAAALALVGCAGGFLHGPALTYDARVYLLDAEEELMTARARAEDAARELEHQQQSLDQAAVRLAELGDGETKREALAALAALKQEAKAEVAAGKARVNRALRSQQLLES